MDQVGALLTKELPFPCTSMNMDDEIDIREMLQDLVWLNAVIATEVIQITENTSAILRKATPPVACLKEHQALRTTALAIAEKYHKESPLRQHLAGHR
jgi:hypothetical protein